MFDCYIRRRDEHRFGMRKHVEAIFAVVMTHTGWSDAAERHRLDKQVDVDLVDGAAAERKLADEAVDRRLVATEDERREGIRCRCDPAKGFVQRPVGQDRQDGAEDFVTHDFVVPGDGMRAKVVG